MLDSVPEPFTRERLGMALDRRLDAARYRPGLARYLGIWRASGMALAELTEVLWIRADGDYSEVRLIAGRSRLHDKSLAALTTVLPPDFVRCHRSCLVNLHHARSLHTGSGSGYWLVMANGKELPVGRVHVSALRRELGIK